jgi:hypothetical protein
MTTLHFTGRRIETSQNPWSISSRSVTPVGIYVSLNQLLTPELLVFGPY